MDDKSVSIKTSLGLLTIPRDKIAIINLVDTQNTTSSAPAPKPAPPGMIYIPVGWFWMGCSPSDERCYKDERPYHRVYLDAYFIDKNDVTVKEYSKCVKTGICKKPSAGKYCNYTLSGKGNHPVNCVDWDQANAYCNWVGKQLPTEAEWEKAARGTDGRIYPWGNDWDASKVCLNPSSTCAAGSYPQGASPYGVMDMAGNVMNWCVDLYYRYYYSYTPDHNPVNTEWGKYRVLRGGSWGNGDQTNLRLSNRVNDSPTDGSLDLGFRCVRQDSK